LLFQLYSRGPWCCWGGRIFHGKSALKTIVSQSWATVPS
jgi:hypothetical protein